MKRIAILGGTFNPIHNGHLKLAENAMHQFPLDECWFMPSPNPPHKTGRIITDYSHRLAMVRLAVEPYASFRASDFEDRLATARAGQKSYTSETLTALLKEYPDTRFYFLMGADSLYEFQTWHEPETIVQCAGLIAASRDYDREHRSLSEQAAFLKERFGAEVHLIRAEQVDISSERIRGLYAAGKRSASKYVPSAVADYISAHRLYDPEV